MQDQRLTLITMQSGVYKELTPKAAEGYWVDADKIRFRFGKAELMGGWQGVLVSAESSQILGQPRALETVRSLDGVRAAVIGTHVGLFSSDLSSINNITPVVTVQTSTSIFNTVAGSRVVTVSVSAHGLTDESIVGFTNVTATIGGNIVINTTVSVTVEYQVSVIDANSFTITVPTTAAATSVKTGVTAVAYLQYPAGRVSDTVAAGWGGGVWDDASFGWSEPTGTGTVLLMRHWSMDTWGTELMAVPDAGPLFLWSPQNGITARFALISAAPSVNNIVRVATEARHVILYGTHDLAGTYDPLLIRWCSSEDYTDWTPTAINTAGDKRLGSRGSRIVGVQRMRDQHLIMTDFDATLQSYIGPNDVFGFSRAGENCGLIARNAIVEYAGAAYWMSNSGQFFKYDGRMQPIPCTVLRYVFQNLDAAYASKVYAGTNAQFDEIIWLYTSEDSTDGENDRYVIYNTIENHWTIGSLRRTTWLDRSTFSTILATGVANTNLYYHEVGYADDTAALSAYLQSAYFDMQDGDAIMFTNKFVPDLRAQDGGALQNDVSLYLYGRKYPGESPIIKGPYVFNAGTPKISNRLRGREFAVRFESESQVETSGWRLGEIRMSLQADGAR